MSGIASDATVGGGGYGYGFGGGFGGIAPVGLFGFIGADGLGRGRRDEGGRDGCCDSKLLQLFADGVNEKFTTLDAHITQGQLQNEIGEVAESVRDNGMALERGFGNVKAGLKDVEFHAALNTKDIISSQKDCCCEVKGAIKDEGCKTRELMLAIETKRSDLALRDAKDENIILRGKLDNAAQTHHLEHILLGFSHRLANTESSINTIIGGTGNTATTTTATNSGTQVS